MRIGILQTIRQDDESGKFYKDVFSKLRTQGNTIEHALGEDDNSIVKCNLKTLDKTYRLLQTDFDALIVVISDWHDLLLVNRSSMQLSNKVILFCLDRVKEQDIMFFSKEINELNKYWNIHVWVKKQENIFGENPFIYHNGDINTTDLVDVLAKTRKNKRKYIGYKHNLNEVRQKIKFNSDLVAYVIKQKALERKIKFDGSKNIPKIIHYCWFGGKEMPEKLKKCMETWKKVLPDYELKCWNEKNFPFEKYRFAQEAQKAGKMAFIADVARLHALYFEGGIYLDTDVEVIKSFNDLLTLDGFTGYESLNLIEMAAIGFKPFHPWVKLMLGWYNTIHCDEDYTEIANTKVVSKLTRLYYNNKLDGSAQNISQGLRVFSREYFSPEIKNEKWLVTNKTYCIHHFTGLW